MTTVVAIVLAVLPLYRSDRIWLALDRVGADVWCDGKLITTPNTTMEKIKCLMKIRTSSSIHVWITHVPTDRVEFEGALRLVRPNHLTIDLAGTSDRQYLEQTFSGMEFKFPDTADYPIPGYVYPHSSAYDNAMAAMDAFMQLERLNPKLFHRLNRFESFIGSQPAGISSTVYDTQNKTWIAIPWPK